MQFIRNLLNEQRRRAIGTLMQYMEQNIYEHLTVAEQRELRARVLGAVGQYHDTCLDMLKASVNDGTLMNEDTAQLLTGIRGDIANLRKAVTSDG